MTTDNSDVTVTPTSETIGDLFNLQADPRYIRLLDAVSVNFDITYNSDEFSIGCAYNIDSTSFNQPIKQQFALTGNDPSHLYICSA